MRYIILFLMLVSNVAYACDSYEDCMNTFTYEGKNLYGLEGKSKDGRDAKYVPVPFNTALLKAIAYKLDDTQKRMEIYYNNVANEQRIKLDTTLEKLDEISKKLDKSPNTDWRHTLCQCGDNENGGCNECKSRI